ncbi:unnamed protein product [Sympodiomycopsis kandeliae]
MSSNTAAAAATPAANAAPEAGAGGSDWKKAAARGLAIYFGFSAVSNIAKNYLNNRQGGGAVSSSGDVRESTTAASIDGTSKHSGSAGGLSSLQQPFTTPPLLRIKQESLSRLIWHPNTPLDFYIFLSAGSSPSSDDYNTQYSPLVPGGAFPPELNDLIQFDQYADLLGNDGLSSYGSWKIMQPSTENALPALKLEAVPLSDQRLSQGSGFGADLTIKTPHEAMYNNGSIWADVVAVRHGDNPAQTVYKARMRKLLTRLYPSRKGRQGKRLVGGKTIEEDIEEDEEDEEREQDGSSPAGSIFNALSKPKKLVTYWHRNFTIAIPEQDPSSLTPLGRLPPPLLQHVHVARDAQGDIQHEDNTGDQTIIHNYPVMFPNTFWDLRQDMNPINATTPTLDLHVQLYVTSWFKFQMIAALSDSFEKQPGMAGGEIDMVKSTLMNTSPWYLGLMLVVTLLHMLFEFLAFSTDVKHWKSKENMAGVSVGSIFTNIATQIIILLYLFDSSEETSWMILGSQAIGVLIEAWKLTKAVTVAIKPREAGSKSWLPYRLDVQDKHILSAEEKETQEYDRLAFKIVAWITAPLLGGYTIYSALYNEHRGWWSFIIGTLCSFVYSFGFVSLIPQVILNYKLKSVAGLNGKTLIYKILSTFVDDVFAFAVPMPTLHRIATLRDDVVFFVVLYQMWIYGVDKTRVNEYGQVADVDAKSEKQKQKQIEGDGKDLTKDQVESKKDQ